MKRLLKKTWKYLTTGIAAGVLVVILAAAFVPVDVTITQGGFLSVGTNVALAVNNPPDWDYEAGDELIERRTRTSKTHWFGENRYSFDGSIGSLHYKDNLDDIDEQWKDIDSSIVSSSKPNWDWEVVKGNWHLLIREDTSIAVGKDGHWIGFRVDGIAYLDVVTKDYVILQQRQAVTPIISGNRIRWEGIFNGVNLEYIYGNDGFKENIEVTQVARDWCQAHPPSDYDLSNTDSYLVFYYKADWADAYAAEDEGGDAINWDSDQEFEDKGIFFRHPVKDYLVSALPLDWTTHVDFEGDEETPNLQVPIRKRFFKREGNHWLLLGSRVTLLNQMPAGTIVFDPTINEYVGATNCDADQIESSTVDIDDDDNRIRAHTLTTSRMWSAWRWTGTFPSQGSTITVAWIKIYIFHTSYDNANFNLHFEPASAPAVFIDGASRKITEMSRTSVSTSWVANNIPLGWRQSPSMVDACQEVIDSHSPTAMVVIARPNTDASKYLHHYTYDEAVEYGAQLHIEYTEPVESEITNAPASKGFGILEVNTYSDTAINFFTIENTGSGAVDVVVYATDLAGGDDTWDLSDTSTPGENIYGLKAGLDDDDDTFDVVVRETEAYNELVNNLLESATQDWGLRLYMPTSVTDYDGQQMASTLTLVCSAH